MSALRALDGVPCKTMEDNLEQHKIPRGLRLGAVRAGIKASGNLDLCAAVVESPMNATAVFTSNQFVAAPITIGGEHLTATQGSVQTVLINAGNANCATGEAGLAACKETCRAAASIFGGTDQMVFPSSTGIIGAPLPTGKIIAALPALHASLGESGEHVSLFSQAIMTTDTRPKVASATLQFPQGEVQLLGLAKGAGMIHPQLVPHATMLVYIFTDLDATPAVLREHLWPAADSTFNCISIDGDTSTNDTVFLGATGSSGVSWDALNSGQRAEFGQALHDICESLALQIVRDGEGVRHVIEIYVTGARSREDARTVAKALAHSPLVKTAWAGEDPNWGRLVSSIGASPVKIDTQRLQLSYGHHRVFRDGQRAPEFDASAVHAYLQQPQYTLHVELGLGDASCRFWTTDLTAEYVHINADYST
jgi:glutamate N-acetyltransferase/amino-acid N-acetyltransferase